MTSSLTGAPLATITNTPPHLNSFAANDIARSNAVRSEAAPSIAPTSAVIPVGAASSSSETFLRIINRATTAPRGAPRTLRVFRPLSSNVIEISGQLPQGDAGFSGSIAVARPAMLFALMLRDALQRRGIAITGQTRVTSSEDTDFTPAPLSSLVEIASRQSPPLSVIARETLKPSQNLYTELLLRQLAAPLGNAQPAVGITAENGLEALRAFLRLAGIAESGVVGADGSGLSRSDFVTADAVVRLLTFMDKHAFRQAFRDALPVAGVDGTLRNRLRGTRAAGNLIAKTGTLSTATSLSGYVTSRGGERLAFSFIINNYTDDVDPRTRFTDLLAVLLADFSGRS